MGCEHPFSQRLPTRIIPPVSPPSISDAPGRSPITATRAANAFLVLGLLAAYIAVVYSAVAGLGSIILANTRNVWPAVAATTVVAFTFERARERAQRFASRTIYGRRATPYEVISRFSESVSRTYETEDVLPRMARVIAEGTGAARADVWLRIGSRLEPAASWPPDAAPVQPVGIGPDPVSDLPGRHAVAVRHHRELLGVLTVSKDSGHPVTAAEDKLLSDIASQAALVLRNLQLTAELEGRLAETTALAREVRASRQRIVAAQDAARRRIERDIHDGAQQYLVALAVKVRLAKGMIDRDPKQAKDMLAELRTVTGEALETLRDLTRGIYPPLLAEHGIGEALRVHTVRMGAPVALDTTGIGRYPADVEAAVYFSCLEALQNAMKYANAHRVAVRISESGGALSFTVSDDGSGFDAGRTKHGSGLQNMHDRIATQGGAIEIRTSPGEGTTISGRIPVAGWTHA